MNQLHVRATYDIAGSAVDAQGNPIALQDLTFTFEGTGIEAVVDEEPTDNNVKLKTFDEPGATGTISATANDMDGNPYEATAEYELVPQEVPAKPFNLVFTEVV